MLLGVVFTECGADGASVCRLGSNSTGDVRAKKQL